MQWQCQFMNVAWEPNWAFRFEVDGEHVGPVRSDLASVHTAARDSIGRGGGVAEVLKAVDGGWLTVATYTAGLAGPGVR
jgi:hypothetical protein